MLELAKDTKEPSLLLKFVAFASFGTLIAASGQATPPTGENPDEKYFASDVITRSMHFVKMDGAVMAAYEVAANELVKRAYYCKGHCEGVSLKSYEVAIRSLPGHVWVDFVLKHDEREKGAHDVAYCVEPKALRIICTVIGR